MTLVAARSMNFDINREGDELIVTDNTGDFARMFLTPLDDSDSIGSAIVSLFGSGNPDVNDQASLFELSSAGRIEGSFGRSLLIATSLTPRLVMRVVDPDGGGSSIPCQAIIVYERSDTILVEDTGRGFGI